MATADQTTRRTGLFVVLPTTDQPILIKKLAWSARVPISRVVLATESSEVCEPWSTQYGNLLRPGEPLRAILGLPDGGSYRLAASAAIDQGKSWMVPVVAAHCALALGEAMAPKPSEARLLVWGTGAIDLSVADTASEARVVAQDYHLTTKIDRSRHLFAEAAHAGTPVLALVPAGDEAERAAGILAKVLADQPHHVAIVACLADIMAPIETFLRRGVFEVPVPKPAAPSTALTLAAEPATADKPAGNSPAQDRAAPPPPSEPDRPSEPRSAVLGQQAGSRRRGPLVAVAAIVLVAGTAAAVVMMRQAPVEPAAPQAPAAQAPAGQPAATPAVQAATAPPATAPPPAATPLARLLVLAAPPGSSCERLVYEARPSFVELSVDVPDGPGPVAIDAAELCGVALSPIGATRARFQPGTGTAGVASLSDPRRIIFNPTSTRGGQAALPTIQIDEPKALKIEITRR